jgi:methyl-accepting chemotaxis protein
MTSKSLRFPIFWKILIGVLFVAGGLLWGSAWFTQRISTQTQGRSQALSRHYKRYLAYQEAWGRTIQAALEVVADDEALRGAIEANQPEAATRAAANLNDVLSRKDSLHPDVFLVFDAEGKVVFVSEKSPIDAADLTSLEAIGRVRVDGDHYHDDLLFHHNRLLQISAVPLRHGKGVLGGVLIGVYVDRYYADYADLSDDLPTRQHKMTFLRNGEVIASAFPREKWAELAQALRPEKRRRIQDGKDTVELIEFDDGPYSRANGWNFTMNDVSGFVGSGKETVGELVLMRTRGEERPKPGLMAPFLIGLALSLVVAGLLAWMLTRSLKKLIRATHEIAEGAGDLTKRIEVSSNDEIADLADNLNRVFDNLHRLAHDVQSASLQVGTSSAEISAASKQMLEGAKDQALKIESSTAAVTELSSSIQTVAANAMSATRIANDSNVAVGQAMESMTQIRRTVEDAADKIGELGESGKRIGNIVEVIRQISEQTSLLALNASIEAAHAGEQGRGFAVVADEVSSLARRVGQSAKDIEDLIATIKDQTSDAVHTMQAGTKGVESGTALVTSTLGNLKQIIEMVQETAGAVQEQAIVSDEIARNMDAVQKIANEVLSSSEEAVIQGEQLHALAYHLEESVRNFNLDGEDALPGRPAAPPPPPPSAPAPRRAIASSASGHRSRRSALRPAARPPTNGGGKA